MENILEVKNLVKNYGPFRALNGISFAVPKGKIIGLLGPNGAGKTTTIHILLGITTASSGSIKYFGEDFFKNKQSCLQRINFASAYNTLQGRISVWENLVVFSYLYGIKNPKNKILELVEYFEISDLLHQRFWDLSAGQKTRVNLIKSLLNDPEILLMDEPTASLDPDIADKTLSLIEDLNKKRDLTILYTSHDMEEVTRICDEVIFLDEGKIVAQDSPLELTKKVSSASLNLVFDGPQHQMEKFLSDRNQKFKFLNNFCVSIVTTDPQIPKLIYEISNSGLKITDIEIKKPTLEDVFLQIARKGEHVTNQN